MGARGRPAGRSGLLAGHFAPHVIKEMAAQARKLLFSLRTAIARCEKSHPDPGDDRRGVDRFALSLNAVVN